jgi:hypothetical protein
MNRLRLVLLMLAMGMATLIWGCDADKSNQPAAKKPIDSFGDANFDVISVGAYNYTTNQILGIYILPPDKNDINDAGRTSGRQGTPIGAEKWSGSFGSGADLAWDKRWKAPYKFKIWWENVFDRELDQKSGPYPKGGGMVDPYDPYTSKRTRPGTAWCEYEIEVKETYMEPYGPPFPGRFRTDFNLYFYPNGTVRGHLLMLDKDGDFAGEDIANRGQLPVLKDKPCIKEIPNPLHGKPKSMTVN